MNNASYAFAYRNALAKAAHAALDPHAERDGRTRKFVTVSGASPDIHQLASLAKSADEVQDSDLVYIVVSDLAANVSIEQVIICAMRAGNMHMHRDLRFWQPIDPNAPMLIVGRKSYFAAASEEVEHHPGKPAKEMQAGFRRAWRKLNGTAVANLDTASENVLIVPTKQGAG